jgi:hypothetical protein
MTISRFVLLTKYYNYQIIKVEMSGKENKNTYRVLVAKTEEITSKPRCRWDSNIKMEL